MIKVKIYYFLLLPLLIGAGLFFLSGESSEFDQDNFDFSQVYQVFDPDVFVSTFPDSQEEPALPSATTSSFIDQEIIFTSQAPLGEWSDPRQQDACEEASVIMAMAWLGRENFNNSGEAKEKIIALADWQKEKYGSCIDTSAEDTNKRLVKEYYKYAQTEIIKNASPDDIKQALQRGYIVLSPCDGRALDNPNFTPPGPERHMLLIRGYDAIKKEFITNDPGTRKGEAYCYPEEILYGAIRDYPTGDHKPIVGSKKNIIIIKSK